MKQFFSIISLVILSLIKIQAQNYLIDFSANGASATVDSVYVENLTQGSNRALAGTDVLHLVSIVGINQINKNCGTDLIIYPNPASGGTNIKVDIPFDGMTEIGLYDLPGKQITSYKEWLQAGRHEFNINNLNAGVFSIIIKSSNWSNSGKIFSIRAFNGETRITRNTFSTAPVASNNIEKSDKNTNAIIQMQYNTGDILLFKGISGIFSSIVTDIPSQSKTIDFTFYQTTDCDNNTYPTVAIGDQIWFAENLKTTKYNDCTPIPNVTGNDEWAALSTPAYCWYENDYSTYGSVYGALYNWYAVDSASNGNKNICPVGWHVPIINEWNDLINYYLGGIAEAGGKLKEQGTSHWLDPNVGATNETGFSAIGAGRRYFSDGLFELINENSYIWSSTSYSVAHGWDAYLWYNSAASQTYINQKSFGYSVRCVKNN